MHHQFRFAVSTRGRALHDLRPAIVPEVRKSGVRVGTCHVFVAHTSASLCITENADPSARRDVLAWLSRLAPDGDPRNTHDAEGPDDSPAHQRSAITRTSETIPIHGGELVLGTWQGIFLVEHRLAGQVRRVFVHVGN